MSGFSDYPVALTLQDEIKVLLFQGKQVQTRSLLPPSAHIFQSFSLLWLCRPSPLHAKIYWIKAVRDYHPDTDVLSQQMSWNRTENRRKPFQICGGNNRLET